MANGIINGLLLLVPVSLVLAYLVHAGPLWVFVTAIVAIAPLAEWIRRATEQLARIAGPAIGGLLNVTFGNVAELTLALFVLAAGHSSVVKGQSPARSSATDCWGWVLRSSSARGDGTSSPSIGSMPAGVRAF